MNSPPPGGPFDETIQSLSREYQSALESGQKPWIEDYLARIGAEGWGALLPLLLQADVRFRRERGQRPVPDDYLPRFPSHAELVLRILNQKAPSTADIDRTITHVVNVRCPFCDESINVSDVNSYNNVQCTSCGSAFSLFRDVETVSQSAETGRTIGHFQLQTQLGVGTFGTVWKAVDTTLGRTVACKVPRHNHLSLEEQEKFFREARAAAQLRHENIVSLHEVGRDGNTIFLITDYIEGVTLADWLTAKRPTFQQSAEICLKIGRALHHAHEAGVIHRDVKTSNIMMDEHLEPHVMDFGLAKREAGEVTMTVSGAIIGTPAYMSPEQAKGEGHLVDRRSDVYSLGVILYELLTGERPFRGNLRMLMHQVIHEEPLRPRRLNNRIPRDLETICVKCLEKDPARRYQSAASLVEDLRRFLAKEPIVARPVGRVERLFRWCERNPLTAGLTATALLLLVAVAVVASVGYARTTAALEVARTREIEATNQQKLAEEAAERERNVRIEVDRERQRVVDAQRSLNVLLTDMNTAFGVVADERGDPHESLAWFATALTIADSEARRYGANLARTRFKTLRLPTPRAARNFEERVRGILPGNRHILLASDGLKIWSLESDEAVPLPGGPDAGSAAWVDDSDRLAVGHSDGRITIHRAPDWKLERTIPLSAGIRDVEAHARGDYLLATSADGMSVWFIDLTREKPPLELKQTVQISGISVSPWSSEFAIVGNDYKARIYQMAGETPVAEATPIPAWGGAKPVFLADSKIVTRTARNTAALLSYKSRRILKTHSLAFPVFIAAASPDTKSYALQTSAFYVSVFGHDGEAVSTIQHQNTILNVEFSPDGTMVFTVGIDRAALLSDPATGKTLVRIADHSDEILDGQFLRDGLGLVTVQKDGLVRVWNRPLDIYRSVASVETRELMLTVSPDGRYFAPDSWALDRSLDVISVYESKTGTKAAADIPLKGALNGAAFSPDGQVLITICSDPAHRGALSWRDVDWTQWPGFVQFWDWRTGKELRTAREMPSEPIDAVFADGETVVVVCAAGELFAIDAGSGHTKWQKQVAGTTRAGYSFKRHLWNNPEKGLLALCGLGSKVYLLEAETGKFRHELDCGEPTTGHVRDIDFSPDGRFLATGGMARIAQVWDVETGKPAGPALGHADWIHQVRFDSTGDFLLTASRDHMARLWNWRTGKLEMKPLEHEDEIFTAEFGPDSQWIATGSRDRTVRLWDRHTGQPLSAPLDVGWPSYDLHVVQGGTCLLASGQGLHSLDTTAVANLHPTGEQPRDVQMFAELTSNRRVEGSGTVHLTTDEWFGRWSQLQKSSSFASFTRLPDFAIRSWHQIGMNRLANRPHAAAWHARRLSTFAPDDPKAWLQFALAAAGAGRHLEAIGYLDKALEFDSEVLGTLQDSDRIRLLPVAWHLAADRTALKNRPSTGIPLLKQILPPAAAERDRPNVWKTLKPVAMGSSGNADIKADSDNSLVVSGRQPIQDVYTLEFAPSDAVAAFRLNAMPLTTQRGDGPGRFFDGSYQLTGLEFSIIKASGETVPVPATFVPAAHQRDQALPVPSGKPAIWGALAPQGAADSALFELGELLELEAEDRIKVVLRFEGQPLQSLAHFSLEATGEFLPFPTVFPYRDQEASLWTLLGAMHHRLGNDQKASSMLSAVVESKPTLESRALLALVHLSSGELEQGRKMFQAVADATRDQQPASTHHWELMQELLETARRTIPDELAVREWSARQYIQSGQLSKAIEEYDALLKIEPDSAPLLKARAELFAQNHDWARAVADWTKLAEQTPEDFDLLWRIADTQARYLKDWKSAAGHLKRIVEPENADQFHSLRLGALLGLVGSREEIEEHNRRMLDRYAATTEGIVAERLIKPALLHPGLVDMSRLPTEPIREYLAREPANPLLSMWLTTTLALADYRKGNFSEAERWLDVFPQETIPYPQLKAVQSAIRAMAEFRLGQRETAKRELQKASWRLDPLPADLGTSWHDLLIAIGLEREARTLIEGPKIRFTPTEGSKNLWTVELIASPSESQIVYTMDGSEPTLKSPAYAGPLSVAKGIRIRAKAVFADQTETAIAEAIIGETNNVPRTGLPLEASHWREWEAPEALFGPMRWQLAGEAVVQQSPVRARTGDTLGIGAVRLYRNGTHFADGSFTIDLGSVDAGDLGIVFRAQSPNRCYLVRISSQEGKLVLARADGPETVLLAEASREFELGTWHEVQVDVRGGEIVVLLDGEEQLRAHDETFARGSVGFFTSACKGARFRRPIWEPLMMRK